MTPKPGFDGWIDKINELERRLSALENKPAKQTASALAPGFNAYGVLLGTLFGHVTPASTLGDADPVTWTKVTTDGAVSYTGSLVQSDTVGQFQFGWKLSGVWPGGFHRFDFIDGVTVCVLEGGNIQTDPKVKRAFVNKTGPLSHGVFTGYGDCIELGITSQTTHHAPVNGQPFAVPSRIEIELAVHQLIEG